MTETRKIYFDAEAAGRPAGQRHHDRRRRRYRRSAPSDLIQRGRGLPGVRQGDIEDVLSTPCIDLRQHDRDRVMRRLDG